MSERDKGDLKFGVQQDIDVVFASFIRKASDVDAVREILGVKGKHILIVSKVTFCILAVVISDHVLGFIQRGGLGSSPPRILKL